MTQYVDVLTAMKQSRMTFFQIRTVALCMGALLIVGYDLSVIALALPYIPPEFFAGDFQRGLVLSAALLGMTIGCFFVAPLADRMGRRTLIVVTLFVAVVAMAGCAIAPDATTLMAFRLLTGIAGGGMLACLFILVQEQASDHRRVIVFGIFTMGFAFGALLAGLAAVVLLPLAGFGWQNLFLLGALATLLIAVLSLISLPESVEYLLAREALQRGSGTQDGGIQKKLDSIVRRLRNPQIDAAARPVRDVGPVAQGFSALFSGGMYRWTFLLWMALIGPALTYFFVSTWTPQLISAALGDPSAGTMIGLYLGLGTVLGSVVLAVLAIKVSPFLFVWAFALLGAGTTLWLSTTFSQLGIASFVTVLAGMACGVAQAGVSALVPALYPVSIRTTASGWLQGLGFLAGFVAPILAGALLAIASPEALFALSAFPLIVGALSGFTLWLLKGRKHGQPAPTPEEEIEAIAGTVG